MYVVHNVGMLEKMDMASLFLSKVSSYNTSYTVSSFVCENTYTDRSSGVHYKTAYVSYNYIIRCSKSSVLYVTR